jgi:hypothetical protein
MILKIGQKENIMNIETNEMAVAAEEKEPIYYAPKRVTMISDIASILSWVVLVFFIGDFIVQIISLNATMATQQLTVAALVKEPSFYAYVFVNLIVPFFTGLGIFVILQAAATGLNMLLEMDFNAREAKSK